MSRMGNTIIRVGASARPTPRTGHARAIVGDDGLNKTERAYRDLLEFRKRAGEIHDYCTHATTFILGKDCRYTPEFMVVESDMTITIIEVKGHIEDDALVKFRAAQKQMPWFTWIMVSRTKNGWETIRS